MYDFNRGDNLLLLNAADCRERVPGLFGVMGRAGGVELRECLAETARVSMCVWALQR